MSNEKKPEGRTLELGNPDDWDSNLRILGGSRNEDFNQVVSLQSVNALWLKHAQGEERERLMNANIAGMIGIAPKDEIEGMMAAQLLAAHNAAMECYRRAMLPEQTFEGRKENLSQANKLSRSYAALAEALDRHRGKGQQKVTVEHVHVHAGGQAVVGAVTHPGGGGQAKLEEQPHTVGLDGQDTMRGADPEREAVPVAGDGERQMPDARRHQPRGAKR